MALTGGIAAGYIGQVITSQRRNVDEVILVGSIPQQAHCFQSRDELDEINRVDLNGDPFRFHLLIGAGGVGKTQIAAEYARRTLSSGDCSVVVWVSASTRGSIQSAYAHAIKAISGEALGDPEQEAQRFLAWTQTTKQTWLVVLDDVESPSTLRELWPQSNSNGQVVATTRRRDSALGGAQRRQTEVGLFSVQKAVVYLKEKLSAYGRTGDPGDVEGLAKDLGYLPLALAQAAAYIVDFGLSCTAYRNRLMDRRTALSALLPDSESLPDNHQATVSATWSLSIEKASTLQPFGIAKPILRLAALLDPTGIPQRILTSQAAVDYLTECSKLPDDPRRRGVVDVEYETLSALRNLHRLSLLEIDSEGSATVIRIHALVQRAVVDDCDEVELHRAARSAADSVLEVWPADDPTSEFTQALRSNADALYRHSGSALYDEHCHDVLLRLGDSLTDAGFATEAVAYLRGLHANVDSSGCYHLEPYLVRLSLGHAMEEAGEYSEAMAEYLSLLEEVKVTCGSDHEFALSVRSALAAAMYSAGDSECAVEAFEALLRDRIRVQGEDHEACRDTRRRLAAARTADGDAPGAIAAYEELLAEEESIYGQEHPHVRHTRLHLAETVGRFGDIEEAIRLIRRTLIDVVREHGENHQETFDLRNRLGRWYLADGLVLKAAAVCESLVLDAREQLGDRHPHVLEYKWQLVNSLGAAGRAGDAVSAATELAVMHAEIHGPRHKFTLDVRGLAAHWKGKSGDFVGAASDFRKVVVDYEEELGSEDLFLLELLRHYSYWLHMADDFDDSLLARRRTLSLSSKIFGGDDERTLAARYGVAAYLMEVEDYDAAIDEFRTLHIEQIRALEDDHPDLQRTMHCIEALIAIRGGSEITPRDEGLLG
ncbi:NB-ARC domain-containing protein [Streptomyces xanthophaeus]